METPLLQTKLYIPPPRLELVPRPRLIERLNAGLWRNGSIARKLTLISAPVGFGKATLVSEWVQALGSASPVRYCIFRSGNSWLPVCAIGPP